MLFCSLISRASRWSCLKRGYSKREAIRYIASTIGIDEQAIRDLILVTIVYCFRKTCSDKSIQWLTDNSVCYTAKGTVALGKRLGLDIPTTLPYSPESNRMVQAFLKTFKRDYVCFGNLKYAKTVVARLLM